MTSLNEMEARYLYSGGSVREFCRESITIAKCWMDRGISKFPADVNQVTCAGRDMKTGVDQIDYIRRSFVNNPSLLDKYLFNKQVQVIDSEYAFEQLSLNLSPNMLYNSLSWAMRNGHQKLAENIFEIFIHRLAANNRLRIQIIPYNDRNPEFHALSFKDGVSVCGGNTQNYSYLAKWINVIHFESIKKKCEK